MKNYQSSTAYRQLLALIRNNFFTNLNEIRKRKKKGLFLETSLSIDLNPQTPTVDEI